MKKYTTILLVGLIAVIVVLGILLSRSWRKENIAQNNLNAVLDTLQTFKDENGVQTAKIAVLEGDKLKNLLQVKTKDSSITKLQEVIKENPDAETIVTGTTQTSISTTTKTDSDGMIYPTYTSKVDLNGWITGTTKATKDSTTLDLKIHNSYDVVLKREKGQLQAYVKNHNPHTETTLLRAATLSKPREKRFGVGPSIGITYNQGFKPTYGLTLQYNIIRF